MAYVPDVAIESMDQVSGAAFKLYAYFCRRRNHKTGDCFPSLRTTAKETGLHYSYASEIRSELVRAGWIEIIDGRIIPKCGFNVSEKPKSKAKAVSEKPKRISEKPKQISEKPKRYIKEVTNPYNQPSNQPIEAPRKRSVAGADRKGTRIPDQFILTPEMKLWATKYPDVDLTIQTELFVNYWRAKPGKDARKIDWTATWRNWIIRANNFRKPTHNATNNKTKSADKLADYNRIFDKYGPNGDAG